MAAKRDISSPANSAERAALKIGAGDTVKVWVKIQEKKRVRLQAFEGLVIAVKHGTEAGARFTVRKVSDRVGVERIFPLYSPVIDHIDVLRKGEVRRAKLYYIRTKTAKETRAKIRQIMAEGRRAAVVTPAVEVEKENEEATEAVEKS